MVGAGVGVEVGVGDGVAVAVAVADGLAAAVGVAVEPGAGVGVRVEVAVGSAPWPPTGVVFPVAVAVREGVAVGVVEPFVLPPVSWAARTWACGVESNTSIAALPDCSCWSSVGSRDPVSSVGEAGVPTVPGA